jgi:hypothetical protein
MSPFGSLSPGNEAQTRSNIWTCTTIPSAQNILTVRSTRMEAELLRRGSNGNWPASPTIIRPPAQRELAGIGFAIAIAGVYRMARLLQ